MILFEWLSLLEGKNNLDLNCYSHRRGLVDALAGFDETLTKHSDYDLVLRYTQHHPPLPINAVAAHYRNDNKYSRISNSEPSQPNFARIRAKHRPSAGAPLRVLIYCYDYPQISESYVDTEIDWFTRQKKWEIRVVSREQPGAPGKAAAPVHRQTPEPIVRAFKPEFVMATGCWQPMMRWPRSRANLNIPVTVRGHGFEYSVESLAQCEAHSAVRSIYLFPHFAKTLRGTHPKVHALPACFDWTDFYPRLQRDRRLVLRAGACLPTKDLDLFIRTAAVWLNMNLSLPSPRLLPAVRRLPAEFRTLMGSPVDIRVNIRSGDG